MNPYAPPCRPPDAPRFLWRRAALYSARWGVGELSIYALAQSWLLQSWWLYGLGLALAAGALFLLSEKCPLTVYAQGVQSEHNPKGYEP